MVASPWPKFWESISNEMIKTSWRPDGPIHLPWVPLQRWLHVYSSTQNSAWHFTVAQWKPAGLGPFVQHSFQGEVCVLPILNPPPNTQLGQMFHTSRLFTSFFSPVNLDSFILLNCIISIRYLPSFQEQGRIYVNKSKLTSPDAKQQRKLAHQQCWNKGDFFFQVFSIWLGLFAW